ncbi:nuclear transport factor 2 family protein [Streptomyces sp. NPDC058319]|uniref:nuclear transport factor 2 family protein n=1 Tax=unclassified Streptomyces TaxID=2593676 RepID=UPI0036E7AD67
MDAAERLAITEDVRRLMARYARYADHHRWQDLAGLFAPDGTYTPYKPDGTPWLRMEGREDIAAKLASANTPEDTLIHHLFSSEVDVDSAASARGVWAMEDLIIRPEGIEPPADFPFKGMHGYGHYRGRFVVLDGSWYIAELEQTRLHMDFTY